MFVTLGSSRNIFACFVFFFFLLLFDSQFTNNFYRLCRACLLKFAKTNKNSALPAFSKQRLPHSVFNAYICTHTYVRFIFFFWFVRFLSFAHAQCNLLNEIFNLVLFACFEMFALFNFAIYFNLLLDAFSFVTLLLLVVLLLFAAFGRSAGFCEICVVYVCDCVCVWLVLVHKSESENTPVRCVLSLEPLSSVFFFSFYFSYYMVLVSRAHFRRCRLRSQQIANSADFFFLAVWPGVEQLKQTECGCALPTRMHFCTHFRVWVSAGNLSLGEVCSYLAHIVWDAKLCAISCMHLPPLA